MSSVHNLDALPDASITYLLGTDTAVDIDALERHVTELAADAKKCSNDVLKIANRIELTGGQTPPGFAPVSDQLPQTTSRLNLGSVIPPLNLIQQAPVMQNLDAPLPLYPAQHHLVKHNLDVIPLLPPVHTKQPLTTNLMVPTEPDSGMCSLVITPPSPPPVLPTGVQQAATFAEKQPPLTLHRQPTQSEQSRQQQPLGPGYNTQYSSGPGFGTGALGGPDQGSDFNYVEQFNDPKDRQKFISGVYSIVSAQLIATMLIALPFVTSDEVQEWAYESPLWILLAVIIYWVTLILLGCFNCVHARFLCKTICLVLMTGSMGVIVGFTTVRFETHVVVITLGMTAGITTMVTLFAIFMPCDITKCYVLLGCMVLFLFIFGIIALIITIITGNKILYLVYCFLAVILFSVYLAYDTQLIMGGRTHSLHPDDYVLGAMFLYLDIIYIFLYLIELVNVCCSGE